MELSLLEQELSHVDIDDCLQTLEFDAVHDGINVEVLLSFIPFRDGKIDINCFLDVIKNQVITKFVLSYKEILKHYDRKEKLEADKYLYEKAIRKFSTSTAKGKIGELLLYLYLEKFFNAPKILSKISSLDDANMQVHGADAVHAQMREGDLVLYLGESKVWKQYSMACDDAVKSIETTLDDYQEEFDLIESGIDFPNIDLEFENVILNFLNPYGDKDVEQHIHTPCFIGFDSAICRDIDSEDAYAEKYNNAAQARIDTFYCKAKARLDIDRITLILLPFESIDDFTEQFIVHLGVSDE